MDSMLVAVALLLQDKPFLDAQVRGLDAKIFPDGPMRDIVRVIIEQHSEYGGRLLTRSGFWAATADLPLEEQEEVREVYDELLTAFPVDDDSRGRMRAVGDMWLRNATLQAAVDAARSALGKHDEEGALEALRDYQRSRMEADDEGINLFRLEDYEKLKADDWSRAIPTDLEPLDRLWEGGSHPGVLAAVMAPTSGGKSHFLAWLAGRALLWDKRVLAYTYELRPKDWTKRVLSAVFQVPIRDITENVVEVFAELPLRRAEFEVRRDAETVKDIITRLEMLEEQGRLPDILLLDSADDLTTGRRGDEWQQLGWIYRDLLVDVAQRFDIAVWTTTQATAAALEKARISLKHMGNSYEKSKRCHLILGLAQGAGHKNNPLGLSVSMFVLKDTLHGSPGKHFDCFVDYGDGPNGWSGFRPIPGTGNMKDAFE